MAEIYGYDYRGQDTRLLFCDIHVDEMFDLYKKYKDIESAVSFHSVMHSVRYAYYLWPYTKSYCDDFHKTALSWANEAQTAVDLRSAFQSRLGKKNKNSEGHDYYINMLKTYIKSVNIHNAYMGEWYYVGKNKRRRKAYYSVNISISDALEGI